LAAFCFEGTIRFLPSPASKSIFDRFSLTPDKTSTSVEWPRNGSLEIYFWPSTGDSRQTLHPDFRPVGILRDELRLRQSDDGLPPGLLLLGDWMLRRRSDRLSAAFGCSIHPPFFAIAMHGNGHGAVAMKVENRAFHLAADDAPAADKLGRD